MLQNDSGDYITVLSGMIGLTDLSEGDIWAISEALNLLILIGESYSGERLQYYQLETTLC